MGTLLRHLVAILTLPFVVALVIPALIIGQSANPGLGAPSPLNILLYALGIILIGVGLLLMVQTISLFMRVGKGTLAPWDPTQRLVVVGIYRYVRNPMISGIFSILLGEVLVTGSVSILVWALIVIVINMIYIPLLEEPGLQERFGADYAEYVRNVPRWLPRLTPWTPPSATTPRSL